MSNTKVFWQGGVLTPLCAPYLIELNMIEEDVIINLNLLSISLIKRVECRMKTQLGKVEERITIVLERHGVTNIIVSFSDHKLGQIFYSDLMRLWKDSIKLDKNL